MTCGFTFKVDKLTHSQIWKGCASDDGIFPTEKTQLEVKGDEEDDAINVSVRTSFLYEKSAACQAIGSFASHAKAAFIPYIDQSIAVLNPLLNYFHEDVRSAALVSIQRMARDLHNTLSNLILCYRNSDSHSRRVPSACSLR